MKSSLCCVFIVFKTQNEQRRSGIKLVVGNNECCYNLFSIFFIYLAWMLIAYILVVLLDITVTYYPLFTVPEQSIFSLISGSHKST